MKNKRIIIGAGIMTCLVLSSFFLFKTDTKTTGRQLIDEALLAIIKNDQKAFEGFIKSGGKVDAMLPAIDGKNYMVIEGIVYFERASFIHYLKANKHAFLFIDSKKDYDILSLSVQKDSSEMLKLFIDEKANLESKTYGKQGWSLMHLASLECATEVVPLLHKSGLNWNTKAKDGSTPLTLAAEKGCLPVLSFWKEHRADFKSKDGRGLTALGILQKKKDAAIMAFAESFVEKRTLASAPAMPNFYKKRKIPKDNLADRAHLIEPEDRPDDANETAEFSEFSD